MFWHKEKVTLEIKCDKSLSDVIDLFRIFMASYLTDKEQDLKKLKIDLMKPLLENQWKSENAIEAERINKALESKGERIRKAWNQYKDDLLELERTGKDTQYVQAKLEVLQKLMEE